ncbi:MAG: SRPBCC family protein [Frankiaceae bacterium]|nr:SRPBCC family protein [Frankiaceae bacterium]
MPRTDSASRVIPATPDRIYAALVDEDALTAWLPPSGMTGRFEVFDARPGGGYRMALTYDDSARSGKSGGATDIVDARYVELTPSVRVVQAVVFDSDDPALAGTMTMTWELHQVDGGTEVVFRADDVPDGISAADHATGMNASLANLARFLADG